MCCTVGKNWALPGGTEAAKSPAAQLPLPVVHGVENARVADWPCFQSTAQQDLPARRHGALLMQGRCQSCRSRRHMRMLGRQELHRVLQPSFSPLLSVCSPSSPPCQETWCSADDAGSANHRGRGLAPLLDREADSLASDRPDAAKRQRLAASAEGELPVAMHGEAHDLCACVLPALTTFDTRFAA